MTTPVRLLLCTDMDRTVIPNGTQPEDPAARRRFRAFCLHPQVTLVYVSGRHLDLVHAAIADFALPQPAFAITDVGTRIYRMDTGTARELESWQHHIDQDWHGLTHADLQALLAGIAPLQMQEPEKQNRHKLSYYLALRPDNNTVLDTVRQALAQAGVAANVLWSIDEVAGLGLVDVLPARANKLHAIEFLRQSLGYRCDEVVFAGDSGNDMEVLASHLPAVLVHNASAELKEQARSAAAACGHADLLYLADTHSPLGMNGNYSAGVLAGVWHFVPQLRHVLEQD